MGRGGGSGCGSGGGGSGSGGGGNGASGAAQSGPSSGTAAPAAALGSVSIEVHHPNGMSETLRDGRYEMRDARGRVIINRGAANEDLLRLRQQSR